MPTRPESWPIPPFPEKPAALTRAQAADVLYAAASNAVMAHRRGEHVGRDLELLGDAVRQYRDAAPAPTPSAIPAEVARVLEAAGKMVDYWDGKVSGKYYVDISGEVIAAVTAYRSSFPAPEPLSARLARLKAGSVVSMLDSPTRYEVLANRPSSKKLFVVWDGDCCAAFDYSAFNSILSEAP